MIPLTIRAISTHAIERKNQVIRLVGNIDEIKSKHDYVLNNVQKIGSFAQSDSNKIFFPEQSADELYGDILLIQPERNLAQRLIRRHSTHNTFLITEQCDQLCIMCSQPPKKYHYDLFQEYQTAALLAPTNAVLGISGGEPLLHKLELFKFLTEVLAERPDLKFHILTNGQHFNESDRSFLNSDFSDKILWGIPLYSQAPLIHDKIVGKEHAYSTLLDNLSILIQTGAKLELRTVLMKQNLEALPTLARFISKHLSGVDVWAIMQLENIGFARKNWNSIFVDTSIEFKFISRSIIISNLAGINTKLYNFPLCTVPFEFREYASSSISDWKTKYLEECSQCNAINDCGGFFQWYDHAKGFKGVKAI